MAEIEHGDTETPLPGEPPQDRPYVLVNRGTQDFVRVRYLADGNFELEHSTDGERGQLYTADHRMVRDVVWSWIECGDWWRTAVAWAPIDPDLAGIEALRVEMTELLDGPMLFDGLTGALDSALDRADELLAAAEPSYLDE